jgi:hypothetical protein
MSDRLEVAVAVLPEAWPVLEALRALSIDVGSVDARKVFVDAPADVRLLCCAVVDAAAIDELARNLARELVDEAARELVKRVAIKAGPLGTAVVIFRDIVALDLGI